MQNNKITNYINKLILTQNMSKRITIMISEKNLKKVRAKQAKLIITSDKSVSLSGVVNDMIEQAR